MSLLGIPNLGPLLGLGLALLLSLAGNLLQALGHARAEGEHAAQAAAADRLDAAVGQVQALRETAERAGEIANGVAEEQSTLMVELVRIADHARQQRVVYRDRIKEVPAADCAPGQPRMQAFNEAVQAPRGEVEP